MADQSRQTQPQARRQTQAVRESAQGGLDQARAMFGAEADTLVLTEGLLQTPRFQPMPRWIGASVTGVMLGNARHPGWAEAALLRDRPDDALLRRGHAIGQRMLEHRLGGACWADPPDGLRGADLIVVAPSGTRAGALGLLNAALSRGDAARIVVVLSPALPRRDRIALHRAATRAGATLLHGPVDPWPLIERAAELHAGGNDMLALLGLLAGVPVHCHLSGLAAGWGATEDAPHIRRRAMRRTGLEIVTAALLQGTRYADPFTGDRIRCEQAVDLVQEWRRLGDANRQVGALVGMSLWKRRHMARFFHTGRSAPPFLRDPDPAALNRPVVAAWSSRIPDGLAHRLAETGHVLARVEDGFVRSVGLGSDFLPPCSVVVDADGIYYDPAKPSGLERILAETEFDPAMLHRARALVDRLVANRVTKYGSGHDAAPVRLPESGGRRRILVPGQVADDLSVRLGGAGVAGNMDLLERVRAAAPDAQIIFKPHPDVDAGHRAGALPDAAVLRHADHVIRGAPMPALIDAVDELHTMTSLAGFEALLRGRVVACHGQPFYAGWGLTRDMNPIHRRTRRLSLEELAAGTLLLYPRYLDPVTMMPCPAELLLDRLADPALRRALGRGSWLSRLRRLQGRLRRHASRVHTHAATHAAPTAGDRA